MNTVVLINLSCSLVLVGLIWFVQIVHYPLFLRVGSEHFPVYVRHHVRATTRVVAPLMLVELVSTAVVLIDLNTSNELLLFFASLLLAIVWMSTLLIQVPLHSKLADNFDPRVVRRLINTNWIRTAAWTLRGVALLYLLYSDGIPRAAAGT